MARCQMLLQENEELGKTIASGKTAKLEGEIALQKTLVTEMKNNQSGRIHTKMIYQGCGNNLTCPILSCSDMERH